MQCVFGNKHLEELYTAGRSKKYRAVNGPLLRKFTMRVQQLEAAVSIHDLWKNPGLNFERLQGENRYSIRVDVAWRLEFAVAWADVPQTRGDITILELSNHYGD